MKVSLGVWKRNIIKFIENSLNQFLGLEYSSTREIFEETNPSVEKTTKIIIGAIMYGFFPLAMLSELSHCLFVYLTTDSKSDAFELLLPFW